jgi:hypothetical protein
MGSALADRHRTRGRRVELESSRSEDSAFRPRRTGLRILGKTDTQVDTSASAAEQYRVLRLCFVSYYARRR